VALAFRAFLLWLWFIFGLAIARKSGKSNVNKIEMENEPCLVPIYFYKYQYALKQGLNLSSSLGLEVREETNFLLDPVKYRDHDRENKVK